jgi:precorrin-6A synthase
VTPPSVVEVRAGARPEVRAERASKGASKPRRLRVIGFGMGPQHVTPEAAEAIASVDYLVAFAKGERDDPLLAVRGEVARQYGDPPVVVVPDPPRDRADPADYPAAVRNWHEARVAALRGVLEERPGDVGILVWGDPSLYDSTLRLVDSLDVEVDVVPGISAPQLLAARHRIVLHEVGRPVHVTTGRRLREAVAAGQDNLVVMLNSGLDLDGLEDWTIWWGANLGATGEALVAGRVGDVLDDVLAARAAAKAEAGWVMDLFLLRAP